jgi:hypothetical protein
METKKIKNLIRGILSSETRLSLRKECVNIGYECHLDVVSRERENGEYFLVGYIVTHRAFPHMKEDHRYVQHIFKLLYELERIPAKRRVLIFADSTLYGKFNKWYPVRDRRGVEIRCIDLSEMSAGQGKRHEKKRWADSG